MNGINYIQIALVVLTTCLAILTSFTKIIVRSNVTLWGRIALVVIIFSLGLSILTEQMKADDEKEKAVIRENEYKSIVEKSDTSLQDLKKTIGLLNSILDSSTKINDSMQHELSLQRNANHRLSEIILKSENISNNLSTVQTSTERLEYPMADLEFMVGFNVTKETPLYSTIIKKLEEMNRLHDEDSNSLSKNYIEFFKNRKDSNRTYQIVVKDVPKFLKSNNILIIPRYIGLHIDLAQTIDTSLQREHKNEFVRIAAFSDNEYLIRPSKRKEFYIINAQFPSGEITIQAYLTHMVFPFPYDDFVNLGLNDFKKNDFGLYFYDKSSFYNNVVLSFVFITYGQEPKHCITLDYIFATEGTYENSSYLIYRKLINPGFREWQDPYNNWIYLNHLDK